jgi:hypothetical protein
VLLTNLGLIAMELQRDVPGVIKRSDAALENVKSMENSLSDLEEATYATEGEIANLADTANGIAKGLSDHEAAELTAAQDSSRKIDQILNDADAGIVGLAGTAAATTEAVKGIAADVHTTMGNSQQLLQAATADLTDPAIHETFLQIAGSAVNLNGMSSDGKKMTTDFAAFVHRETAPVRGTWNVVKGFIGLGGPLGSIATAIK